MLTGTSQAVRRPPMDSAFYDRPAMRAALGSGADVSVTGRLDPKIKATASLPDPVPRRPNAGEVGMLTELQRGTPALTDKRADQVGGAQSPSGFSFTVRPGLAGPGT